MTVTEALLFVRRTGQVNMFDRRAVVGVLRQCGESFDEYKYIEAADEIDDLSLREFVAALQEL